MRRLGCCYFVVLHCLSFPPSSRVQGCTHTPPPQCRHYYGPQHRHQYLVDQQHSTVPSSVFSWPEALHNVSVVLMILLLFQWPTSQTWPNFWLPMVTPEGKTWKQCPMTSERLPVSEHSHTPLVTAVRKAPSKWTQSYTTCYSSQKGSQ